MNTKIKYNKHIKLLYDETEEYNNKLKSILELVNYKNLGICINRSNLFDICENISNKNNIKTIQIFTGSPKSYQRKNLDKNEENKILQIKEKYDMKIYIHSIFIINLSRNFNNLINNYLQLEFNIANKIKSNGVVFHVGKQVTLSKKEAMCNMKINILDILEYATVNTPLILETPAGQGTELLTTYQEFSEFFEEISSYNIAKNKFKICIDTCHVFASGIDPFTYIQNWIFDYGSDTIALIHFNDSCGPKGCKKDRHQIPGNGYIGKNMENIYNLCLQFNLDLVFE